jgi:hypothetical protein
MNIGNMNIDGMLDGIMVFENEQGAVMVERNVVIEIDRHTTVVYYKLWGSEFPSVYDIYKRDNKIELSSEFDYVVDGNQMVVTYKHI